ncbi:NAD-dependent epimerase/dehydratase family protein [Maridesulfovibrio ferrireducens]|uniref:NAD-dependent epimerase/dehydratase family protein n=1 Tax=Maridesulfovibrio ferrireducens TaxID=246191 RepID=UPI001A28DF6F|nr:NAD-dependent epimerase/dehydratase family protein [Maridesulfovibrio ferrireducens]MBI9111050.1 NAD-dependent epimerase/dehydratase family protein [Maridesulfovibrio ferrireducens]
MNKKTCLVTGCAGFIGSHLTQRLLDLGHFVVGVDNLFSGYVHNMSDFLDHPDFKFHEVSVVEKGLLESLKEAYPALDIIFQLAAIVSVPYSIEVPEFTMEVNFDATKRMLESSAKLGLSAFVFAGSAAEYGNEERLPVREEYATDEVMRLSPYGVAKYKSSSLIEKSGYGCSLRFFNIFGPRQDPTSQYSGVISRFVDFGLAGKNMVIFGDGTQSRDFLYVSDVVDSYLIAAGLDLEGRGPLTGIYNVGTGHGISVLQLAETVSTLTLAPSDVVFKPERAGDIKHSRADISKISVVGFSSSVSFEDGLKKTIEWAKSCK